MPTVDQGYIEHTHGMLLAYVSERTADILIKRASGRTLESIGRYDYRISRERIRQIEHMALQIVPKEIRERLEAINLATVPPCPAQKTRTRIEARKALRIYLGSDRVAASSINYQELYQSMGIAPATDKHLMGIDGLEQIYQEYGIRLACGYSRCWKCGTFKPLTDFLPIVQKDPVKNNQQCRECNLTRTREYFWKNHERMLEYNRNRYAQDPGHAAQIHKKYELRKKLGLTVPRPRRGSLAAPLTQSGD